MYIPYGKVTAVMLLNFYAIASLGLQIITVGGPVNGNIVPENKNFHPGFSESGRGITTLINMFGVCYKCPFLANQIPCLLQHANDSA